LFYETNTRTFSGFLENIYFGDDIMDIWYIIQGVIAAAIIIGTTALFIKYILFGDIVERNLDKLVNFLTGKKKVVK